MSYNIVQIKDNKTGKWVKIDRKNNIILSRKITKGKYKNIPVARKGRIPKSVKVTCEYCKYYFITKPTDKRVSVYNRTCPIIKEDINANTQICDEFIPHEYIICEYGSGKSKVLYRLHIDVCYNKFINGKCSNCKTGKIVQKIKEIKNGKEST